MLRKLLLFLAALLPGLAALRRFTPSAFLIKRQIGQLGVQTETEWEYYEGRNLLDPESPRRTTETQGASVRLFDAELQDGRRVLLKEFVGGARAIGANEAAILERVSASAPGGGELPGIGGGLRPGAIPQPRPQYVTQMLGTMEADRTFASDAFRYEWSSALPNSEPPASDGLWLAYSWKPLYTVAGFPAAEQPAQPWSSIFDFEGWAERARRMGFVKLVARRCLEAVAWLHGSGIVHRSIGGSSLLLSTYDQSAPAEVVGIKLLDLGFAASAGSISEREVSTAMARGASSPLDVIPFLSRADDLHALAYVLLELVLRAASPPPSSASTSAGAGRPADLATLKRLVEDIYKGDLHERPGSFRDYCAEEESWAAAVEVLDEADRAGWALLQSLVACREPNSAAASAVTAQGLLSSAWLF